MLACTEICVKLSRTNSADSLPAQSGGLCQGGSPCTEIQGTSQGFTEQEGGGRLCGPRSAVLTFLALPRRRRTTQPFVTVLCSFLGATLCHSTLLLLLPSCPPSARGLWRPFSNRQLPASWPRFFFLTQKRKQETKANLSSSEPGDVCGGRGVRIHLEKQQESTYENAAWGEGRGSGHCEGSGRDKDREHPRS